MSPVDCLCIIILSVSLLTSLVVGWLIAGLNS